MKDVRKETEVPYLFHFCTIYTHTVILYVLEEEMRNRAV